MRSEVKVNLEKDSMHDPAGHAMVQQLCTFRLWSLAKMHAATKLFLATEASIVASLAEDVAISPPPAGLDAAAAASRICLARAKSRPAAVKRSSAANA